MQPLSCDALVFTPAEHGELIASGTAMARAARTPLLRSMKLQEALLILIDCRILKLSVI